MINLAQVCYQIGSCHIRTDTACRESSRNATYLTTQLRASLDAFAAIFSYYGCCLGPAWFRIPSWLGLAGGTPLWTQFVGIIPPIVCINVAIRTYENKSFF